MGNGRLVCSSVLKREQWRDLVDDRGVECRVLLPLDTEICFDDTGVDGS